MLNCHSRLSGRSDSQRRLASRIFPQKDSGLRRELSRTTSQNDIFGKNPHAGLSIQKSMGTDPSVSPLTKGGIKGGILGAYCENDRRGS
jgi:hypothetical protein